MKRIALFALIIFFMIFYPSLSQKFLEPRKQYGGFLYLDFNFHNVNIPNCPEDSINGLVFNSAKGIGTTFGGLIDIPLNKDFNLLIKPSYFNQSGMLEFNGQGVRTIDGVETNANYVYKIDASIHSAGLEALGAVNIYKDLSFQFGFRLDYVYKSTTYNEEFLMTPEQGTYPNGKRSQVHYNGEISCASAVSTSIVAGLSYELPLNYKRTIRIAPELSFVYRFNSIIKDESWNMYALRLGASIKFSSSKDLDISIFPKERNIATYEYNLCNYDKSYFSIPDIANYSVNINSEAGIKGWDYKVVHNNLLIDSLHNLGEAPDKTTWKIDDKFAYRFYNEPSQAQYIVTIYDNAGQSVADTSIIFVSKNNAELTAEINILDSDKRRKLDSIVVEDQYSCEKDNSLAYPPVFFINTLTNSLGELSEWKLNVKDNEKTIFDTIGTGDLPKEIAFYQNKMLKWLPKSNAMLSFQLEITDSRNNTCYSNIIKVSFKRNKYELKTDLKIFGLIPKDSSFQEIPFENINIVERNSTRLQPLLNYIFFDENSAEIPKRYTKLQWVQTKEFTLDLLHQTSIIETYHNILNIIGKRLVMYPQAKLTIVGCNTNIEAEKDNLQLSQKRAEAVRDYLRDVWSIPEDRLIIQSRNAPANPSLKLQKDLQDRIDAIAEDRRVEIYCDTYEVLDPILTTGVRYEIKPSKALLKPFVKNDADISTWYIIFETEKNNYVISPRDDKIPDKVEWDLENLKKTLFKSQDDSGIIKMSVTDSKEQLCINQIPIKLQKSAIQERVMLGIDTSYDEYSLILFDFDSYKIEGLNKRILDFIKTKVNTGAVVDILGYTDRIGTTDYNMTLSTRRAESARKELNLTKQKVTTKGLGESSIYNNDTPEGRFYCRTVNILVKNPVNAK